MSTLDYLDEQTINIVTGYIKNAENMLSSHCIPPEITRITLLYVDDHFMLYRGTYQWTISGSLFNQMLTASQGQKFTSDVFEINKLHWYIYVYPNGGNLSGDFEVYIALLSLPANWSHIQINCSIHIPETNTTFSSIVKCDNQENQAPFGWHPGMLQLNEIIHSNINKLTIIITNKILRIASNTSNTWRKLKDCIIYQSPINNYKRHYKFEWTLNKLEMEHEQYWHIDKYFSSNMIGDIFFALYLPLRNQFTICIAGFPNEIENKKCFVDGVQIKWSVYIKEANINMNTTSKFDYKNYMDTSVLPSFTFDNFKQYQSVTFIIDIKILNEYDPDGNIVGVNAQYIWDKYISTKNKNNFKTKNISNINKGTNIINCEQTNELYVLQKQFNEMIKEFELIKSNKKSIANIEHNKFKIWLFDEVKMNQYYDVMMENGYDNLDAISLIKINELKEIGIDKIGHRKQIMKYVCKLKSNNTDIKILTIKLYALYIVVGVLAVVMAVLHVNNNCSV